jgi:hypothetical protein
MRVDASGDVPAGWLVWEVRLGAARGLENQIAVDLVTSERDAGGGPLAYKAHRSRRRQRPHPMVLTARVRACAPSAGAQDRARRLGLHTQRAGGVRCLSPV